MYVAVSQEFISGVRWATHLCAFPRVACRYRIDHFPSTASWDINGVHNTCNAARPISLRWCCGFL